MADPLHLALGNLASPVILFFALGVLAAALRSDLELPEGFARGLSLYLMVAIGFRGGVELAAHPWSLDILGLAAAGIALSLLTPLLAYPLLRRATPLARVDAAAVAAAYGSVSVVTFVTAAAVLGREGVPFAGHLVAVLALMETPAIVSGLVLARRAEDARRGLRALLSGPVLRSALVSGSVLVLLGSLAIGWASGAEGLERLGPLFVLPFEGILALFLLEMGMVVVRRVRAARNLRASVVAFGLYMPLLGAALGLLLAWLLRLSVGDATLLMVLAASASYIAVPAALRHALPRADPGVYVTLSIAVTFPFNVLVGIPLYFAAAQALLGG